MTSLQNRPMCSINSALKDPSRSGREIDFLYSFSPLPSVDTVNKGATYG